MRRIARAPVLLLCAACINTSDGILNITIDVFDGITITGRTIPTETMSDVVMIEGFVTRAPPLLDTPTDVTVAGGATNVTVRIISTGRFRIEVPMVPGAPNRLVFSAEDVTGAVSTPFTIAVTHVP